MMFKSTRLEEVSWIKSWGKGWRGGGWDGGLGLANAQRLADRSESPGACRAAGDTEPRGHKGLSKKWVGSEQGTDSTEGVVTSAAVLPHEDGMEDSRSIWLRRERCQGEPRELWEARGRTPRRKDTRPQGFCRQ